MPKMKMCLGFEILIVFLTLASSDARADDAAIAGQLKALGGQVTETGGVVTKVDFKDCSKLAEPDFQAIGQLAGLKELTLYGNCHAANDGMLAHLAKLRSLESLSTNGIQVTDEGLKQL